MFKKRNIKKGAKSTKLLSFSDDEDDGQNLLKTTENTTFLKKTTKNPSVSNSSLLNNKDNDQPKHDYSAQSMLSLISEQKTLSANHNNTQKLANKVSKVTFKKESLTIPDATAIYAARKAREEKKRIASIDDFISLNANGDEEVDEERSCGDEDDEEDEEFEDAYKGSKIGFGLNSILDEEIQRKKEFSESFMEIEGNAEKDSDSDESMAEVTNSEFSHWETDQMKKGGVVTSTSLEEVPKRKYVPIQPKPIPIPTLPSLMSSLTNKLSNLQYEHSDSIKQLKQHEGKRQQLAKDAVLLKENLVIQSERYDFFMESKTFFQTFASLLDVKIPKVEELELELSRLYKQKTQLLQKKPKVSTRQQQFEYYLNQIETTRVRDDSEFMNFVELYYTLGNLNEHENDEFIQTKHDISNKTQSLLDDIDQSYTSLSYIIEKYFQSWYDLYQTEYTSAFGTLSVVGVAEFFVRFELLACGWEPFSTESVYKPIEEFKWHQTIINSRLPTDESMTHLKKIIEKYILPRVFNFLAEEVDEDGNEDGSGVVFDLLDARIVDNVRRFVLDLQVYFKDDDKAYKILLTKLQNLITKYITQTVQDITKNNHMEQSNLVFWKGFQLFRNTLRLTNRIYPTTQIQQWTIQVIHYPLLSTNKSQFHSRAGVYKLWLTIKQYPNNWYADFYTCPSEWAFFENVLKSAYEDWIIRDTIRDEWIVSKLIESCVGVKCFQLASLVGKLIRNKY